MSDMQKTEQEMKQDIINATANQVVDQIKPENIEIKSAIKQLTDNVKMLAESQKSIAELLEKQNSKKESKHFFQPIGANSPSADVSVYNEYIERKKHNPEYRLSASKTAIDRYKEIKSQPTVNSFRYDFGANGGYTLPQTQLMPTYNDTINTSLENIPLYMDIMMSMDPLNSKKQVIYDEDFRSALPDSAPFEDAVAEASRLSYRIVDLGLTETKVFQTYPTITTAEDVKKVEGSMIKAWNFKIARSFISNTNVNENLESIIPNIVSNNRFIETTSNVAIKFADIESLVLQADASVINDPDMYLVISSVAKKDLYTEVGTDGQNKNDLRIVYDAMGFKRIRTSRGDIKLLETDIQDDVMGVNVATKTLTNGSIVAAIINFRKTFIVGISSYEMFQLDRANALLKGSSVSVFSAFAGSRIRTEKHSFGLKYKV